MKKRQAKEVLKLPKPKVRIVTPAHARQRVFKNKRRAEKERHANLDVVRRYDDNRADHGGQVAAALSAIVAE